MYVVDEEQATFSCFGRLDEQQSSSMALASVSCSQHGSDRRHSRPFSLSSRDDDRGGGIHTTLLLLLELEKADALLSSPPRTWRPAEHQPTVTVPDGSAARRGRVGLAQGTAGTITHGGGGRRRGAAAARAGVMERSESGGCTRDAWERRQNGTLACHRIGDETTNERKPYGLGYVERRKCPRWGTEFTRGGTRSFPAG